MQQIKRVHNNIVSLLVLVVIIGLFYTLLRIGQVNEGDMFRIDSIQSFKTIFLGILLEALPFILIGSFVSSFIQIFVSEEALSRIIPKNHGIGIVVAASLGLIFPICECAIIPVIRRLIKKGVPLHMAIAFMLAAPILNPVVLLSTYYAFGGIGKIVIIRGVAGFVLSIAIANTIRFIFKGNQLLQNSHHNHQQHNCCGHHEHHHSSCSHEHHQHASHGHHHQCEPSTPSNKLIEIMEHSCNEFFDVGKYLILGATLSALMQTFVPRASLFSIGQGNIASILVMLSLAFILSLCSEADAFVARTFLSQFTTGSIMGFLVLGPMIDIKNTLMLLGAFKKRFVLALMGLIFLFTFAMSVLLNLVGI